MIQAFFKRPGLWLAAGASVVAVALMASAGLTSAQTPTPAPGTPTPGTPTPVNGTQSYEEILADELDVSVNELRSASEQARDRYLDQLVDAGDLTENQADYIRDKVPVELLTGAVLQGNFLNLIHEGFVTKASDVIGIERDELREELRDGRSLTEVAEEHNVSRTELRDEIVTAFHDVIDRAEQVNIVTNDQASDLRDAVEDFIDDFVLENDDDLNDILTPSPNR
jgi:predicted DNA-binding protein YlxM (UPF0122 family)